MIQLDAPAIGFRAFNWSGGALRSIGVSAEWPVQREPQVAKCEGSFWIGTEREQHPEGSPVEGCTCGLYAYSKPGMAAGIIKAVTIGYGRLIVHPDGWRAEKSEIIGLIAPPKPPEPPAEAPKCEHRNWDLQKFACTDCGWTAQALEQVGVQPPISRSSTGGLVIGGPGNVTITNSLFVSGEGVLGGTAQFEPSSSSVPSLAALEILAEQYGARVIPDWDAGVALAQEQGAAPIPDEVYTQAAKNAPSFTTEGGGGYLVPPLWTVGAWTECSKITAGMIQLGEAATKVASSMETYAGYKKVSLPSNQKSAITGALKLKREKRELHAKHWKPNAKAA